MKKNHRTIRFRIRQAEQAPRFSLPQLAAYYTKAEKLLAPLPQKCTPIEAVILVSMRAHMLITGKEYMSQEEIIGATNLLRRLWETGLFIPSSAYPYTLTQTQVAWDREEYA